MQKRMFGLLFSILLVAVCATGCGTGQPETVEPAHLGYGVYRFNAYGERWVRSFVKFLTDHPELQVTAIYSATEGGYGWTKSVLVVTEGEVPPQGMKLEGLEFVEPVYLRNGVYRFNAYGEMWVRSLVKFIGSHPELRVVAIYSATEGGYGWTKSVLVITESR